MRANFLASFKKNRIFTDFSYLSDQCSPGLTPFFMHELVEEQE
jgi:hypothetical protein